MNPTRQSVAGQSRFGHIAIRVRDVETSRRFYEQGLGLDFVGYRPSGSGAVDLSDGSVNMTILPYDGPDRPVHEEGTEHIHIGLFVPDATAVYQRLLSLGMSVLRADVKARLEPGDTPPPGGSFKVADPDGNVVDVTGNTAEWRA
jgi:catechol 2,3-dioxygenase-like lactoylglutathione lyase family enzyme